ncbi:hypothetical protein Tco_0634883 [Tanacetum coccineum]
MVIFAVNDLDSRFATLAEIICHREPLPTYEMVRNMLLLKESSFNDYSTSTTFESSSSSPTILMASSLSKTKGVGSGLLDMLRERLDLSLLLRSPLTSSVMDSKCCDTSWIFEFFPEHPSKLRRAFTSFSLSCCAFSL